MQPFTRSFRWAVALLVLLTALPSQGFAQAKIKVAIWEFENHAETHYWYSGMLGPAARNQIDTEFSENSMLSSKFSVIERDKLGRVNEGRILLRWNSTKNNFNDSNAFHKILRHLAKTRRSSND